MANTGRENKANKMADFQTQQIVVKAINTLGWRNLPSLDRDVLVRLGLVTSITPDGSYKATSKGTKAGICKYAFD